MRECVIRVLAIMKVTAASKPDVIVSHVQPSLEKLKITQRVVNVDQYRSETHMVTKRWTCMDDHEPMEC